ncbi:hypothetical protein U1Q18_025840 [Sarracenia purpurea var. burkii]
MDISGKVTHNEQDLYYGSIIGFVANVFVAKELLPTQCVNNLLSVIAAMKMVFQLQTYIASLYFQIGNILCFPVVTAALGVAFNNWV